MGYVIEEIIEIYLDTNKTLSVKFRLDNDKPDQIRVLIDNEYYNWYMDNYNDSYGDLCEEDEYDEYYDYNKWDIDLYSDEEKIVEYITERYELSELPKP